MENSYCSSPFSLVFVRWTQLIRSTFPHRPCFINLLSFLVFSPAVFPVCNQHHSSALLTLGHSALAPASSVPRVRHHFLPHPTFNVPFNRYFYYKCLPLLLLPNNTADADSDLLHLHYAPFLCSLDFLFFFCLKHSTLHLRLLDFILLILCTFFNLSKSYLILNPLPIMHSALPSSTPSGLAQHFHFII